MRTNYRYKEILKNVLNSALACNFRRLAVTIYIGNYFLRVSL